MQPGKEKNIFYLLCLYHLIIWTIVPYLSNKNLPLDVIEALAWGQDFDLGYNKHPPLSAWIPGLLFKIFGNKDWIYYLLSQVFIVISFIFFPTSNTATLSLVFWQAINIIPVIKQKNILFIFKFS